MDRLNVILMCHIWSPSTLDAPLTTGMSNGNSALPVSCLRHGTGLTLWNVQVRDCLGNFPLSPPVLDTWFVACTDLIRRY